MYWFRIERADTSIAFTSGMPPPSSVASVRAACEVANFWAIPPSPGSRSIHAIEPPPLARPLQPLPDADRHERDADHQRQEVARGERPRSRR